VYNYFSKFKALDGAVS